MIHTLNEKQESKILEIMTYKPMILKQNRGLISSQGAGNISFQDEPVFHLSFSYNCGSYCFVKVNHLVLFKASPKVFEKLKNLISEHNKKVEEKLATYKEERKIEINKVLDLLSA